MKIKIIDIDHVDNDEDVVISLSDCGFQIGDVVEVSGQYEDGSLSVQAIRDTEFVSIGNEIGLQEGEYEVIEE